MGHTITTATTIEPSLAHRKAILFDAIAPQRDAWKRRNQYYHRKLEEICARTVRPGSSVLELGCGTGDLLAHRLREQIRTGSHFQSHRHRLRQSISQHHKCAE